MTPIVWGRAARRAASPDLRESAPQTVISLEMVGDVPVIVLPGVFNGIRHHTGAFLAESIADGIVGADDSVLDLGTGSGVCAVAAGKIARRVLATDINPEAVRCAWINILAHHLEAVVETRAGDLFGPVGGERFDVILWNPPFFHGEPRDAADHALRSPDACSKFLATFADHLGPEGRAFIVLSPDTDIEEPLLGSDQASVSVFRTRPVLGKTLTIYEVLPR